MSSKKAIAAAANRSRPLTLGNKTPADRAGAAGLPAIAIVSSHVARGCVGLRASGFACERLGHQVWSVPTVSLAFHPGHGPSARLVTATSDLEAHLTSLAQSKWSGEVGVIMTGYLGDAEQAHVLAAFIRRLKEADPSLIYICDPVMGDRGGLYVPNATAVAISQALIPLADYATPNLTELSWLAGRSLTTSDEIAQAAFELGPETVLVTSAPALMRGHLGLQIMAEDRVWLLEHRVEPAMVSGTGDLFAGLLAARLARQTPLIEAATLAAASVCDVVHHSVRAGSDELLLAPLQNCFHAPRSRVIDRELQAIRREHA